MTHLDDAADAAACAAIFPGGDQMAQLCRATDWAATPLGPVRAWPPELTAALRMVMPSRVPMALWWGPKLAQVYNDAYRGMIGAKHPGALGQPAAECWAEVWDACGPLADTALIGEATYAENLRLRLRRYGYEEETYWTFSYSPIRDAGGEVAGVLVTTTDTTGTVLTHRRLDTLEHLGRQLSTLRVDSPVDVLAQVADILSGDREDVPFALSYCCAEGEPAAVTGYGLSAWPDSGFPVVGDESPLAAAVHAGTPRRQDDLAAGWGLIAEPGPIGPARPDAALVVPIATIAANGENGANAARGENDPPIVVILGLNPYRPLDAAYRTFLDLVAARIGAALIEVSAHEAERRRAEGLVELDRAKTRFLQNVGHELRTPTALLIGPIADLLADPEVALPARHRDDLTAAQRAASRLHRMIDGLSDIAAAEEGLLPFRPEPTDLAALTAETAAMFRSVITAGGLDFRVQVPTGPVAAEVDREMWAKIVVNLVANAFKYTAEGAVTVRLDALDGALELSVADTGVGIAEAEQSAIFQRFHRAPTVSARSGESAGIGLALVDELVRRHDGQIRVTSALEAGSTFTVRVPHRSRQGAEARPLDPGAGQVGDVVAEAASWGMPGGPERAGAARAPTAERAAGADRAGGARAGQAPRPADGSGAPAELVLVVEDNADLRDYLARLVGEAGFAVAVAADVPAALRCPARPDLVLADVMMPGQDGIELVRALRAQQELADVPVVLLTALTGSDSVAAGLAAGANDYLTKPFEPVELLARVRQHLELSARRARVLREAGQRAEQLQGALASSRQIGMAVGVVMAMRKVDAKAAFDLLAEVSQHRNVKVRDLAADVVLTGRIPEADAREPSVSGHR